jgi:hypothetical protein
VEAFGGKTVILGGFARLRGSFQGIHHIFQD